MNTLRALAITGLLLSSAAFFYMLWLTFEGPGERLASAPSWVTIISLSGMLVLWADRLYRLVLNKDGNRPLALKQKWAKEGLTRLFAWSSTIIAFGVVWILARVYLPADAAIAVTVAGLLLFGIPMFRLETRYCRARASLTENG